MSAHNKPTCPKLTDDQSVEEGISKQQKAGKLHLECYIQLDWTPCVDTYKINLPQDREGYDRFEYTEEQLLMRRIHWWCEKIIISFWGSCS